MSWWVFNGFASPGRLSAYALSRQAAIASSQTYSCSDRFPRSGHKTFHGLPVKADSELAYAFYPVEVRISSAGRAKSG